MAKPVEDWTFREVRTDQYTHGLHQYPARMHPEIAKRVIQKYATSSKTVILDPFMGSGGVLVESMIHGTGFRIMPDRLDQCFSDRKKVL